MLAYVGCRTTKERNARGKGLEVFAIDGEGSWRHQQTVADLVNPSFLAFGPGRDVLYVVHGDHSEVSAFRIDPADGRLTFLNRQSTEGRNPVHLVVDGSGRFLVIANYATGTVALLPLGEGGALEPVCDLLALPGTPGPHRTEQPSAHPHQVLLDPARQRVLVPDKGFDKVFVIDVDAARGKLLLDDSRSAIAKAGAAPRHSVFHPRSPLHYYVNNELDSTVTTYRYDAATGKLSPLEVVSTLPPSCVRTSHTAAIQITPDGRHLYVSNRGDDSVAIFAVDPKKFTLRFTGCTPSGGAKPRFITLDQAAKILYVANEDSDSIVPFAVDGATGALTQCGKPIQTGSPVCIVFR